VVTHAYNPSYLEGRDQLDHSLRPSEAKSYREFVLVNMLGMVIHSCTPAVWEVQVGRIKVLGWLLEKVRPYIKNN
jgi:hypothetical protein